MTEPKNIEHLRTVVRHGVRKVDGVLVDATTANAILTVYDALNESGRAKLAAMRIDKMAAAAWKLVTVKRRG